MLFGLFILGDVENGEGILMELEEVWGEVWVIMGDVLMFGVFGIDCGDVNWGFMIDVLVFMVMGEGGVLLFVVDVWWEVIFLIFVILFI